MADGTVRDKHFIYGIFYNSTVKSITANGSDEVGIPTLNGICIIVTG